MIQVLDGTRYGTNVIGTSLPTLWARSKKALMLNFYGWRSSDNENDSRDFKLDKDGCIDLSEVSFCRDKGPLIPDSNFPMHQNYSLAYIHHLINANELLAEILLLAHNLYQLLTYCKEAKLAREGGHIDSFCAYMEGQL